MGGRGSFVFRGAGAPLILLHYHNGRRLSRRIESVKEG